MASKRIRVEGHDGLYYVTENLGYSHDREVYAKAVMIDGIERIVVSRSRSGPWSINKPYVSPGLSTGVGQTGRSTR